MNNEINKQGARELSEILRAFAEGKTIQQWQSNGEGENFWVDVSDDWHLPIDVDFFRNEWTGDRIKPESNYRPFKNADECWAEMLKHQPFGWVADKNGKMALITRVGGEDAFLIYLDDGKCGISYMKKNYTFADGTPFGMKEGDEQ